MQKLTLTLVGYKSDIENAKYNIEDFMENRPDNLKQSIKIEEIDFEHREQYVVRHDNMDWAYDSLEKALELAIKEVIAGVPANKCTIERCVVSYLDGVYDGINQVKEIVVRMDKVMS